MVTGEAVGRGGGACSRVESQTYLPWSTMHRQSKCGASPPFAESGRRPQTRRATAEPRYVINGPYYLA